MENIPRRSYKNTPRKHDPRKALWIWYPGDFEIWLGNRMNCRRTERGAMFPPFWRMDSHHVCVEFSRVMDLKRAEQIKIRVEGRYNVKLDGKLQFGMPETLLLSPGPHKLCIKVWNQEFPPMLYVKARTLRTDSCWLVTAEDKEWIDESGKASDTSATEYVHAEYWDFDDIDHPPRLFELETERIEPVKSTATSRGRLYDFGLETFGYLMIQGLTLAGDTTMGVNESRRVRIYYGESAEEALDREHCETLDVLELTSGPLSLEVRTLATGEVLTSSGGYYHLPDSKALRYVYMEGDSDLGWTGVSLAYEFLPEERRGHFSCNDHEICRIWDVAAYTMQLTTREFFIDGIKRDRWVWSGDAVQSYLMNYYLFFDSDTVKRTTWLLRGKDPVTAHINTIMDYTFYWFIGIGQYYLYSGDRDFVAQVYPRMKTLMDWVLSRTNADGMAEGQTGDWVFVDWADFPMSKRGALSFEQILLCRSLETMADCARLLGYETDAYRYNRRASDLRSSILPTFWDEERQALVHNVENGVRSSDINKFANMFGITLGFFNDEQKRTVMRTVMENPDVPPITTPYMRFYELEALCQMGRQERVLREMKAYWGGMIREGATSFWEKYNPEESGKQHLAMYGRPYGKSLCHAWGASPIYLLGRYYMGVRPVRPGYEEWEVRPSLGGLRWMKGIVPTPHGYVAVSMDQQAIRVRATEGRGYLYITSRKREPTASTGTLEDLGGGQYRLWIGTRDKVSVSYKND